MQYELMLLAMCA